MDDQGRPTTFACYECLITIGRTVCHHDCLDDAWAEAGAALPEGWALDRLWFLNSQWWARAVEDGWHYSFIEGDGPTPAAALRALAEKLRSV